MKNNNKKLELKPEDKEIKVAMIRAKQTSNINYKLNDSYSFQYYQQGDREAWVSIQYKASQFENMEAAYERFDNEFGNDLELLKERLIFVVDKKGNKIATTMMWFMEDSNQNIERLHWVAVEPGHEGQGIAHAMIKKMLDKYENRGPVYLTTQVKNYIAISIYYKFGFIPYPFKDIKKLADKSIEEIKNYDFETIQLKEAWKLIDFKIKSR